VAVERGGELNGTVTDVLEVAVHLSVVPGEGFQAIVLALRRNGDSAGVIAYDRGVPVRARGKSDFAGPRNSGDERKHQSHQD
jgi:hypothetical protein